MKIKRLERLRDLQRSYHQRCKWVMQNGIYAPYSLEEKTENSLSWWYDTGFILGDRRVIVWWRHPRQEYADLLDEMARNQAGKVPESGGLLDDAMPNYQSAGRSRKRIVSYDVQPAWGEKRDYYDRLASIRQQLQREGIDAGVKAGWRRERLSWATGVELVAPLEVHNAAGLERVCSLSRRLLLGETSLEQEFPGYSYGKMQWRQEQGIPV